MGVLKPEGDRLAILTDGVGVLAVDEFLPQAWSHANPVDIHNVALGQCYADALGVLLDEREADAILVLNCPIAVADSMKGTGLG